MKVSTPTVSWHNRERVSSVDFQPVAYPKPTTNGATAGYDCRLASAGDDKHVVVREGRALIPGGERGGSSRKVRGKFSFPPFDFRMYCSFGLN